MAGSKSTPYRCSLLLQKDDGECGTVNVPILDSRANPCCCKTLEDPCAEEKKGVAPFSSLLCMTFL